MSEVYSIIREDDLYYTSHYRVKYHALDDPIYFFAECSINPDTREPNSYYYLELFFSVGLYGNREHLIGLYFGDCSLGKEELDYEIRSYIISQLDEVFPDLIRHYLKKEALMDAQLDNEDEAETKRY